MVPSASVSLIYRTGKHSVLSIFLPEITTPINEMFIYGHFFPLFKVNETVWKHGCPVKFQAHSEHLLFQREDVIFFFFHKSGKGWNLSYAWHIIIRHELWEGFFFFK